jgi:hypothetical protein
MRCALTDDPALGRLAEHLGQPHDRHGTGGDDIRQHLPRTNRRQLIDIADEHQCRAVRQSAQQRPHQWHVNHRGFVDDQQIAVERRLLGAPESSCPGIGFEQAVDRLGFEPGAVGQALGSATGRRTERDRDILDDHDLQDRVDQCRLADPGPAGDHQHLGLEGDAHCLDLTVGELQLCPVLDPRDRLGGVDRRPGQRSDVERSQLRGNLPLGPV